MPVNGPSAQGQEGPMVPGSAQVNNQGVGPLCWEGRQGLLTWETNSFPTPLPLFLCFLQHACTSVKPLATEIALIFVFLLLLNVGVHSIKHLWSACYVPGTILCPRRSSDEQNRQGPCPFRIYTLVGGTDKKQDDIENDFR